MRYTKLKDWIIVITLLYERTLKTPMVHEKNDEREGEELKRIYNHYLGKRKDDMKSTQFKVENAFGDIANKDNFSQEQITKLNKFLAKIM